VKKKDEDIGIDIGFLSKLFKKEYAKYYMLILLLLIPLTTSLYLRMQSDTLPKTDEWARNSVYQTIQGNLRTSVTQQYPNLPEANLNKIVQEEFQKILSEGSIASNGQQVQIEDIVKQNSDFLKSKFQDSNGQTYLLAIDPYYYYRLTRNAVNNGYQYDFVDEDGKYHDTKVFGGMPLGDGVDTEIREFHVLLQLWLVKIARIFNPQTDIMAIVFLTPVLIGTLAVIPAFFITRKLAGNTGGFFAAMLVAIHPAYLTRTAGGFSDTDAYNVFFPLLIAWFVMEAFYADTYKKTAIYATLGGLSVGVFSFAWKAWYFIFDFMLATGAIALGYVIVSNWNSKKLKNKVQVMTAGIITFFVSSAIFVGLISGFNRFFIFISGIFTFTQIKDVGNIKIWPNVYTTVAELNPASLGQAISQMTLGSKLWLFFSLFGIVLPLMKKTRESLYFAFGSAGWLLLIIVLQKNLITSHLFFSVLVTLPLIAWILYSLYKGEELDIKYSILLAIWIAATLYASSKGVRFILLLVPAFAISAGITVGIIANKSSIWLSRELKINKILTQIVVFLLFFAFMWYPTNMVRAATTTALNEIPSMNDDWFAALDKINLEAEPDAIINSWWDFGHWFAAIGNRSVTLDGGRQNSPQAHWLGKLMLTWDEAESIGILRYLDCGANTGFMRLSEHMEDDLTTINTLYEIIPVDKDAATSILQSKGLEDSEISEVLQYTHCDPPENYFITSEDMVGKSGVWAHFGSWNFTRAVMYNKVNNQPESVGTTILKNEFGYSDLDAANLYREIQNANADQWIAPWPGYAGNGACSVNGDEIACNNGLVFNMGTEEATLQTDQGTLKPKAIAYVKDGEFNTKVYNEDIFVLPQTGRPIGFALVPSGASYRAILMDYTLTGSIFTRLFYYENLDKGLKHFKQFHKVTDVTGQKIIVWKVDWEGIVETADEEMEKFATCLKDSGAQFFGTETCPWCTKQKELLQYAEDMPYVDCQTSPEQCADVTAYPTWKINGESTTGFKSIEQLSNLTGCIHGESVIEAEPKIEEETEPETTAEEYSLVKVEHILISTSNRSNVEAAALANDIYSQITEDNFQDYVENSSECSIDTISCNLGWFGRGVLLPEFEEKAFSVVPGEISAPFESALGVHIIRLVDTKE